MVHWASEHVLPLMAKNRIQKHPELTYLQYFEIGIPKNFKNESFRFSQYSQKKIFFGLISRFLRSSH